jgi:hypothetical protein
MLQYWPLAPGLPGLFASAYPMWQPRDLPVVVKMLAMPQDQRWDLSVVPLATLAMARAKKVFVSLIARES